MRLLLAAALLVPLLRAANVSVSTTALQTELTEVSKQLDDAQKLYDTVNHNQGDYENVPETLATLKATIDLLTPKKEALKKKLEAAKNAQAPPPNPKKTAIELLRDAAVQRAVARENSVIWLADGERSGFPSGSNKCNLFVAETLREAGMKVPNIHKGRTGKEYPPTAADWANPYVKIPGWVTVKDPLPGDVAAVRHEYSDATGHVGIVVAPGKTASANAHVGGRIAINDWGFRSDEETPTFRRYQGEKP